MTDETADRIATALEHIALMLDSLTVETPPSAIPEPTCAHPMEARLHLGTVEGAGWLCGLCQHRQTGTETR